LPTMHYKVIAYRIKRRAAVLEIGLTPYMGRDISLEAMKDFVATHFTGPEDSFQTLEVEEYKSYENECEWIHDVHSMITFEYLQKSEDYAGEILEKYGLPREEEYRMPRHVAGLSKRAELLRQQLRESAPGMMRSNPGPL
jgi:hypothetical protein